MGLDFLGMNTQESFHICIELNSEFCLPHDFRYVFISESIGKDFYVARTLGTPFR